MKIWSRWPNRALTQVVFSYYFFFILFRSIFVAALFSVVYRKESLEMHVCRAITWSDLLDVSKVSCKEQPGKKFMGVIKVKKRKERGKNAEKKYRARYSRYHDRETVKKKTIKFEFIGGMRHHRWRQSRVLSFLLFFFFHPRYQQTLFPTLYRFLCLWQGVKT